jgi:Mg/Co/Ni transporter MgtE
MNRKDIVERFREFVRDCRTDYLLTVRDETNDGEDTGYTEEELDLIDDMLVALDNQLTCNMRVDEVVEFLGLEEQIPDNEE